MYSDFSILDINLKVHLIKPDGFNKNKNKLS
jgi:hypothetical protein